MTLPAANPERLQKGFAYFAHAARGDVNFTTAAAEELGGWEEASYVFAATTTELLHQLAVTLDCDVALLSERLTVEAAKLNNQGAAPA